MQITAEACYVLREDIHERAQYERRHRWVVNAQSSSRSEASKRWCIVDVDQIGLRLGIASLWTTIQETYCFRLWHEPTVHILRLNVQVSHD